MIPRPSLTRAGAISRWGPRILLVEEARQSHDAREVLHRWVDAVFSASATCAGRNWLSLQAASCGNRWVKKRTMSKASASSRPAPKWNVLLP